MGRGLSVGLGIDFGKLDRDLNQVADRIEGVGKSVKIQLGGAGGIDAGKSLAGIGDLGDRLATGIASGVRSASSLLLGFTAHIDGMLNRVSGAALTLFQRIDAAMKFPTFDAFFTSSTAKLKNFTAIWRKPLSDLDLAISGAFGGMVGKAARVFKVLIDQLAASIAGALKDAVSQVVVEFARLSQGIGRSEASAAGLLATVEKTKTAANRFDMGKGGIRTSIPGPRIGAGTDFTAPIAPAAAAAGKGADLFGKSQRALLAFNDALGFTASIAAKFAVAFVSIPLGIITPLLRVKNFMAGLGDVSGKTFDQLYRGAIKFSTLGVFGQAEAGSLRLKSNINDATTSVGQLTGAVKSLGGSLLAAFGIVGVIYKATQFLIGGVKAASDLNQTVAQSKVVFGDSFGAVEAQANRLNSAFRISKAEQLGVANSFGSIAQGAGLSERASAGLANQLTGMAGNLASSVGISFAEAGDAIKSGLVGRGIELKGLGVVMDEATVKAYGLSRGFAQVGGELTSQSTVQARAELIMRGLSFAQGALERNAGSSADQFRKAGGGIQEFGLKIGELLLPAVTAATAGFNEFLAITLDVFEGSLPTLKSWASVVTDAFAKVGVVVRNWRDYLEIAKLKVGEFVINTIEHIKTLPANLGIIFDWIKRNWQTMLGDLILAAGAFGKNLITNFANLGSSIWEALQTGEFKFNWTPLLDGFVAETEKMPELIKPALTNVDGAVKEIQDRIAKREAGLTAGLAGPGPTKAGPLDLDKSKKDHEYKLASAVEVNSKEAASIIARSQSPGANKDAAREGVNVAKNQLDVLKSIDNKTKGQINIQVK